MSLFPSTCLITPLAAPIIPNTEPNKVLSSITSVWLSVWIVTNPLLLSIKFNRTLSPALNGKLHIPYSGISNSVPGTAEESIERW